MKRLISLISILLALTLVPVAMAAESVTLDDAGGRIYDQRGNWVTYVITVTIVTAADGSLTAETINAADAGIIRGGPLGWCLDEVIVDPGTTKPLADSDITITQNGDDLLDGNGTDLVHSDNTLSTYPACDGQAKRRPIYADLSLDITGNNVNSATVVVYLIFARPN